MNDDPTRNSAAGPIPAELASTVPDARRRPGLTPPARVWVILACCLASLVGVRWGNVLGDHAIINVLTFILCVVMAITLGVWFFLRSAYPAAFRWCVFGGLVISGATAASMLEVYQMSGELVPKIRLRGSGADRQLDVPVGLPAEPPDLSTVTASDFPQFLGPDRLARVDRLRLSRDWSTPPRRLWRQPIGAGWAGFVAVNGNALTMEQRGEQQLVTCYKIASGELLWANRQPTRHSTLMGGTGPRSTPTVHAGCVYALGAEGRLQCLDGATGATIWDQDLMGRYQVSAAAEAANIAWGRAASPLIVDDLVVIPAGGTDEKYVSLAAFQAKTGEIVWEGGDHQVSYSSPQVTTLAGTRQVICVNEDNASGHDPRNGRVLWEIDWPGKSNQNASVSQAVPVPPDRVLLTKGYGAGAGLFQLLPLGNGKFQVTQLWREPRVLKTKFCNVVIHDKHIYGLSDGILECVDLETGQRKWKRGRYQHGQILGVHDLILVQAESGEVVLVEANPTTLHELGRFQAIEGTTWNNLCLYGNLLLVRNAQEAACYELPVQ